MSDEVLDGGYLVRATSSGRGGQCGGRLLHLDAMASLHTSDNPAVPFFHESRYADAVSSAGNAALLQQIVVNRFGHCLFTPFQIVGAWHRLLAQIHD